MSSSGIDMQLLDLKKDAFNNRCLYSHTFTLVHLCINFKIHKIMIMLFHLQVCDCVCLYLFLHLLAILSSHKFTITLTHFIHIQLYATNIQLLFVNVFVCMSACVLAYVRDACM